EHLIRQIGVTELRSIEGLDEVNVKVTLWLSRGPVIRGSKEQVAHAFDATFLPFDLVLPDLKTGIAQVVATLHQRFNGAVVRAIQRVVGQSFGSLVYLCVVV